MNQLFFSLSSAVLLLFLVFILVYFKYHYKSGRLERLMLFTYAVIGFVYWMIHLNSSGSIVHFPHFYRVGGGLWMLSVVLLYYCSRMIYQKPIGWKDYLQLIPILIYFINFLPFILESAVYKIEVINNVMLNSSTYGFDEGWLIPGKYILLIRISHRLLIAFLIGVMIYKCRNQNLHKIGYRAIVNFYFWFVLLSSFPEIFSFFDIPTFRGILLPSYLYLILGFIFLIIYFIYPQFLYGFEVEFNRPFFSKGSRIEESQEVKRDANPTSENLSFKQHSDLERIEIYLQDGLPFLDVNFSLGQLESETGISSKKISQAIKVKYDLNFSQFINKKRIAYVLQKLQEDKHWRNYSVEALALNVGFNSPNRFYNYFKNQIGKTPREFINNLGFREEMTGS